MTFTSFEPTRNVQDFHLAAFAYYDGLDVIDNSSQEHLFS